MAYKTQRIQDLLGLVHRLYDPELAEDWDNVGLQVGDPAASVDRVIVALDPSPAALTAAADAKAQALITHHPLIFQPLKKLTPDSPVGQVIWTAVHAGIAIISAHTNLDSAADGLNQKLANLLGIKKSKPLQAINGNYFKLIVFVPEDYQEAVATALFSAGAGQIGAYDQCSFRQKGTGTFRASDKSNPFIGQPGSKESVDEIRLETVLPKSKASAVLEKMIKAHPYEEVAFDLFPLMNSVTGAGLGRIGSLEHAMPLEHFAALVKDTLQCNFLRICGGHNLSVKKVAICGGSGASLLQTAFYQGADVLVTGDVKYHDAREAESLGMTLIDAGHFATEQCMVDLVTEDLKDAVKKQHWKLEIIGFKEEKDPFQIY